MWPLEKRLIFRLVTEWLSTTPPPPHPLHISFVVVPTQQAATSQLYKETRTIRMWTLTYRSSSSSSRTLKSRWDLYESLFVCADAQMPNAALRPPADHVSCLSGPAEEHDLHVRPRHLPAVRGPNERVPHLPQSHRAQNPPVLDASSSPSRHTSCPSATTPAETQSHELPLPDHPDAIRSASQGRPQVSYSTPQCFSSVLMDFLLPGEQKDVRTHISAAELRPQRHFDHLCFSPNRSSPRCRFHCFIRRVRFPWSDFSPWGQMLLTCLFFAWLCASQQIHNLCWGDAEVSPLTRSVKFSSLCCSRAPAAAQLSPSF